MALVADSGEWKVNRINCGLPFHVEEFGPYKLVQVVDARGTVALSGPKGAIAQGSREQADALCAAANAGQLRGVG